MMDNNIANEILIGCENKVQSIAFNMGICSAANDLSKITFKNELTEPVRYVIEPLSRPTYVWEVEITKSEVHGGSQREKIIYQQVVIGSRGRGGCRRCILLPENLIQ